MCQFLSIPIFSFSEKFTMEPMEILTDFFYCLEQGEVQEQIDQFVRVALLTDNNFSGTIIVSSTT
jgi:hypothetical protein